MTPKEQAKALVDKFTTVGLQQRNEGIQCALIAVDEIIKLIDHTPLIDDDYAEHIIKYWQQVKQEIESYE